MSVTIRQGIPADLPAVLQVVRATPEAPRWPEAVWYGFLDAIAGRQRTALLAVNAEAHLCGVLAATTLLETSELESVLVAPSYRRKGTARALVTAWLGWASKAGASEALLEVRASNAGAIALYADLGFEFQGRRKAYYHDPVEDALLMGRTLVTP